MPTSKAKRTFYADLDVSQWLDSLPPMTRSVAINSLIRAHIESLDSVTTSVQVSPPGGATPTSVIAAEDKVSPGVSTEQEALENTTVALPSQVSPPSVPTNDDELPQHLLDVVIEMNRVIEALKAQVETLRDKFDERSEELAIARAEIKELTEDFEADHYTLIEIHELLQELPALEAFREIALDDLVSTFQDFPLLQQQVEKLTEQMQEDTPPQCEGGGLPPLDD